jgi:hypothetical protein
MSTPQHPSYHSAGQGPYGYGDQSWPQHSAPSGRPPGRPPRRVSGVALPLLLVVGVLVASLGAGFAYTRWQDRDRPERADTIAEPAGQPGESGETVDAPVSDGAGDTLTKKQAKAALLTVKDLPSGWSVDKSADDSSEESTTEPARCAAIFDAVDKDKSKPVAEAKVNFSQGFVILEETVASYRDDVDDAVKETAEALNKCPEFTSVEPDGSRAKLSMSGLSFPNLGDRTLATRIKGRTDGVDVLLDIVIIAVGHNIVMISAGGLTPVPGDDLEAVAKRAVAKLG